MNKGNKILMSMAITTVLSAAPGNQSFADIETHDPAYLAIYRTTSGELAHESLASADALVEIARTNGSIQVWVAFDVPVELVPERRTTSVRKAEKKATKAAFKAHIRPLLKQGLALEYSLLNANGAPGCMVTVTAEGLLTLIDNRRIIQIIAATS